MLLTSLSWPLLAVMAAQPWARSILRMLPGQAQAQIRGSWQVGWVQCSTSDPSHARHPALHCLPS